MSEEGSLEFHKVPISKFVRRLWICNEISTGKKIRYKTLSEMYGVSIRTIKEDVAWIRGNFEFNVTTNKIVEKVVWSLDNLNEPETILKYVLPFLSKYVNQMSK